MNDTNVNLDHEIKLNRADRRAIADKCKRTGRFGELEIAKKLREMGYGVVDLNDKRKNHPNVDLRTVNKSGKILNISVKSTSHVRGTIKFSGTSKDPVCNKSNNGPKADVVVLLMPSKDGRSLRYFIVPVDVVERAVRESHEFWLSHKKMNGEPRKDSVRMICFYGEDTPTIICNNFAEKWKEYEDNWGILEEC